MIHAPATTISHRRATPLRQFLETETGGVAVLFAAAMVAFGRANVDSASYQAVWETHLGLIVGGAAVELTSREWINSGLMAFFFFDLETPRDFDLGELRELLLSAPLAALVTWSVFRITAALPRQRRAGHSTARPT